MKLHVLCLMTTFPIVLNSLLPLSDTDSHKLANTNISPECKQEILCSEDEGSVRTIISWILAKQMGPTEYHH